MIYINLSTNNDNHGHNKWTKPGNQNKSLQLVMSLLSFINQWYTPGVKIIHFLYCIKYDFMVKKKIKNNNN